MFLIRIFGFAESLNPIRLQRGFRWIFNSVLILSNKNGELVLKHERFIQKYSHYKHLAGPSNFDANFRSQAVQRNNFNILMSILGQLAPTSRSLECQIWMLHENALFHVRMHVKCILSWCNIVLQHITEIPLTCVI